MYITIFEQKNKCNMADFQGKYNGDQIEQLLDKANDIDLTKYALKTDNAPTATKLRAARTIALSGAVTGSVSSDFGSNVTISTTLANFDASKIASGTISIDRLPKTALERLIVVADDTARFALTTSTAQSGDTVKVTSTGKMYLIKDESKLNSEDGYEPYTASQASSVPWSGVTGKPSTFTPPTSSATVLGGIKVGYPTSGKNYKVQLDSSGNAYVNVPWTDTNTTYTNMGAASASAAAWSPHLPPERKPSIFVVMEHGKPLLIPHIATWVERRPQPQDRRDWYPLRLPASKPLSFVVMAHGWFRQIPHTLRLIPRP